MEMGKVFVIKQDYEAIEAEKKTHIVPHIVD